MNKRRSIRLKEYDYSKPGAYFVTICSDDRQPIFGDIVDCKIRLNEIGRIIEKWLQELPNKFLSIQIDESIIMPNHFHGIILINDDTQLDKHTDKGTHAGVPLHRIIQWFKTITTNDYFKYVKNCRGGPVCPPNKLWQRNYYEHIIRNENDLNEIREYIVNNPAKWPEDRNNPLNINNDVGARHASPLQQP